MRRLSALLLIPLLAACGNNGGSSSADYQDAKAVATAAGCTNYTTEQQTTLYAADTGNCRHNGHYIQVDWFKDPVSLTNYRQIADTLGGPVTLYGTNWAITCVDHKTDCDTFKTKVGGTLD